MFSYVIGRSQYADIVLPNDQVGPRHAELLITRDQRSYLTDCGCAGGTFLWVEQDYGAAPGQWHPVRQCFLPPQAHLRFADHVTTLSALLAQISHRDAHRPKAPQESDAMGRWRQLKPQPLEGAAAPIAGDSLPYGPVERDPLTGEIIRRSL